MRKRHTRGFAFLKMEDPRSADVIASQDHQIDGRQVDVKKAVPRTSAPPPARGEIKKLFVGGLPPEVDQKEFNDVFSKYGKVVDAIVMLDRNTQRSRGFGFVTFETEEAVRAVLADQIQLHGKFIETKRAEPRSGDGSGHGGQGGGFQPNNGVMGGMGMNMMGGMYGRGAGGRGGRGDGGMDYHGGRGGYGGGRGGFAGRGGAPAPPGGYSPHMAGMGAMGPMGGAGGFPPNAMATGMAAYAYPGAMAAGYGGFAGYGYVSRLPPSLFCSLALLQSFFLTLSFFHSSCIHLHHCALLLYFPSHPTARLARPTTGERPRLATMACCRQAMGWWLRQPRARTEGPQRRRRARVWPSS